MVRIANLKDSEKGSLDYANLLYESKDVLSAQPSFWNIKQKTSEDPVNNTYYNYQWGLNNTGQGGGTSGIDIKALNAWKLSTGTGIKIAVLDEGVQLDHPDLKNNLLQGYDVTYRVPKVYYEERTNGGNQRGDNQGTNCAGIIAAENNDTGVVGVAYNAKIIPVRIAYSSENQWVSKDEWTVTALRLTWPIADIISNSWTGGGMPDVLKDEFDYALTKGRNGKGCVIVFASGNDNKPYIVTPASYNDDFIVVGAVDRCGYRSGRKDIVSHTCDPWPASSRAGSSYGSQLDVVAPGTNIATTDLVGTWGYNYPPDNDYVLTWSGTSAACPFVAGVAALMLSANPNLTQKEVGDIICSTAQRVRSNIYNYQKDNAHPLWPWHEEMGYGMVNAYAAVSEAICYNNETIFIGDSTIANNNILWDKDVLLYGTFIIEANATVTLTATARCNPNAKIIVEPGGRFVVNGGLLTNACDGKLWQGIEVRGDLTKNQSGRNQGWLEMKNAIIENAKYAVYVGDMKSISKNIGNTVTIGGGGVVRAENTIFRNNFRDVEFMPYIWNSGSNETNNYSRFIKCNFYSEDRSFYSLRRNPAMKNARIRLFGVRNISFEGCTFVDKKDKPDNMAYEIALYANRSSIQLLAVTDVLGNVTKKNVITGFDAGIYLLATGTRASTIEHVDFYQNRIALQASVSDNIRMTSCNVGVGDTECKYHVNAEYGVFLEFCNGYLIENNRFEGKDKKGVGICIVNSGDGENLIQYNDYYELCMGILASDRNAIISNNSTKCTGLQFRCSNFHDNNEDIRIDNTKESRIRFWQGTDKNAAGNIFANSPINIRNASDYTVNYFYQNFPDPNAHCPYNSVVNYNTNFYKVSDSYCEKGIGYIGKKYSNIGVRSMDELTASYEAIAYELREKKAKYNAAFPAPVNWEEILHDEHFFEYNHQAQLLMEISNLEQALQLTCQEALTVVLSNNEIFEREIYNGWLMRENKLSSYYTLMQSHLEVQQWDKARDVLKKIPELFPEFDEREYKTFSHFAEISEAIYREFPWDDFIIDFDIIEIEPLSFEEMLEQRLSQSISEHNTSYVKFSMRENKCNEKFPDDNIGIKSIGSTEELQIDLLDNINVETIQIDVHPNPANNTVFIALDKMPETPVQYQLYDIQGRELQSGEFGDREHKLDISRLNNGIYFITVTIENRQITTRKIMKE